MIRRVSASGKPNGVVEMRRERRSGNQHSEGENHSSIVPVCSGAGYRIKSFDVSKYRYRTFDISHLISYRKFRYLEISACKYFDSLLYVLRIVMLLLFSATWGGGSTGVIQEPRHRPLLLVSYRTARIREPPPPADWSGH